MPATRRHVVMTCIFLIFVLTPLFLIPVFPDVWLMHILSTNHAAVYLLSVCAGLISIISDRIIYGKHWAPPEK